MDMQAMNSINTNTAEMILQTSPVDFFSCVQHIEERISAKTLEILSSRNWEGPLTHQDWMFAEELVLDPATISSTSRDGALLFRLSVRGYHAEDIRLHIEGDLLCICGYAPRSQKQPRMFYSRIKLPAFARGFRCMAWLSASIVHIALSHAQAYLQMGTSSLPIEGTISRVAYAAAM